MRAATMSFVGWRRGKKSELMTVEFVLPGGRVDGCMCIVVIVVKACSRWNCVIGVVLYRFSSCDTCPGTTARRRPIFVLIWMDAGHRVVVSLSRCTSSRCETFAGARDAWYLC